MSIADAATTVFTAMTTLVALVLSYKAFVLSSKAFGRDEQVRREELDDRRHAQARLVTCWWTHVDSESGEDLSLHSIAQGWPSLGGHRVWVGNSSEECVYDLSISGDVVRPPGAEGENEILRASPSVVAFGDTLRIHHGTLPPKDRVAFLVDSTLATEIGRLTVHFSDSAGRRWRRNRGVLVEEAEPVEVEDDLGVSGEM